MWFGALLVAAMGTLTALYGHFLPRRTVILYWAGFLVPGFILARGFDLSTAALLWQVFVGLCFAVKGVSAAVSAGASGQR